MWCHFYTVVFCSCLQEEQEKRHCELEAVMGKVASLQTENKKLLLEKNNIMAGKKMLETEMQMTQKTSRSYHSLIFFYRNTFYF